MDSTMRWDRRFLDLAQLIAGWSKDPSTKVGCIVVGGNREILIDGYNGFPRGVADDERLTVRESKYPIIVHAEENAVAAAARVGARLEGCTLYSTMHPCVRCTRLIIQAGVSTVVSPSVWPERWTHEVKASVELLREVGIEYRLIDPLP